MDTVKVLIADQSPETLLIESKMIAMAIGCDLVGEASDGNVLLQLVEETHPHVIILDSELPPERGIDYAKAIQDIDPSILTIFAISDTNNLGEALEVHAFDYLVKPLKLSDSVKIIEKARDIITKAREAMPQLELPRKPSASQNRFMIRHKDGVAFAAVDDILLIQREERSTVIYTKGGGRYVTSDSLSDTEARLDPDMFFRCHKSYVINLKHISSITPYGRWTYIVKLDGITHDALITHEKYEELIHLFS